MKLTSHERILRLFRNEELDRPLLKLWGAGLVGEQLHPAYRPVSELAAKTSDLFVNATFPFNIYAGTHWWECLEQRQENTADLLWKDLHTVLHTPKGDLHSKERISTVGEPSYILEYMIKEPEDVERLLSLPYDPYPVKRTEYDALVAKVGDRGLVMPCLDHAGYSLQRMMGSETLAYFSVDHRELLLQAVEVFAKRIRMHAQAILETGIAMPFQWVGPELFLPPLMGPDDFDAFVLNYDKPLCDLIHERGGYVWVHAHGKVAKFIDRFITMGVDVLNPLEPPKNGDIDMSKIVARYGRRIGWEGNIEIQELLQAPPERVRTLIEDCVRAGNVSGRFVLCPSAGYMEYPFPSQAYIDNLLLYLQYGLECVERCRS